MQNTQDLSAIVSLIMQNPSLIEQIAALAKAKPAPEPVPVAEEDEAPQKEEIPATEASAIPIMRSHRHELLNAMKPYLSENRRTAIDSMASILDVIDVMTKKG